MRPLSDGVQELLPAPEPEASAPPPKAEIKPAPPARNWEKVSSIVTAMGVLVGVVTFALGYLQYTSQVESGRAEHTLDMIEMWETRGYRESYLALGSEVAAFLAAVAPEDLALVESNARAASNFRKRLVAGVLDADSAKADFDKVVYFFNRLGLCVEANVCSERTAQVFFEDTLLQFTQNFGEHLGSLQAASPGFATGLTLLEARFKR